MLKCKNKFCYEKGTLNMYFTQVSIIVFSIAAIFIAITIHEFTRAAVSSALGDTIPKRDKRVTLNPFKHFEPIGFILMLATGLGGLMSISSGLVFTAGGFGWGNPVDTSALYYKNRKRDTLITAVVPTIANLIAAFVFFLVSKFSGESLSFFCSIVCAYNLSLVAYNLVPISPMDCLKVLSVVMPANQYFKYLQYEKIVQMLFLLILFTGRLNGFFGFIISRILFLFQIVVF